MKKIIVVSLFLIISGFTPQLKSLFVQETFAAAAFGDVRCGQFSPGYIPMAPYPGSPYFETELSPDENLCQVLGGTQTEFMDTTITPDPSIIYDKVSKGQSVTWTCSSVETIRSNNPENWGNQEYYSASCGYTPPKVNGSCGGSNGGTFSSKPTTNLCTEGTASSVNGSGPWTWSCSGSNGGTTASCSADKSTIPSNPSATMVCGGVTYTCNSQMVSYVYGCINGAPTMPFIADTTYPLNPEQTIFCTNNYPLNKIQCPANYATDPEDHPQMGIPSISGSCPAKVNGSCGTASKTYPSAAVGYGADTLCAQGTASPVNPAFPTSGNTVNWSCTGSNGGTTASCSASKAVSQYTVTATAGVGGSVSPTTQTVPSGGSVTVTATPSSGYTFSSWSGCTSVSGTTCTVSNVTSNKTVTASFSVNPTPVNGSCGASNHGTFTTAPTTGLCDVGTATPLGGSGPWTWSCSGSNGGTPTSCSANHGEVIITKNHSIPCTPLTYVAEWNAEWSDCEVTSNWFPDGSIKCTQHMIYTPKVILQDYMTETTTTTYENGTVVGSDAEITGSCHPDAPKPSIPPKVNTLKLNLNQPSTIY